MIKASEVEKIKKGIDPFNIYTQYLDLKRAGHSHNAKCPFHNGQTSTSFVINNSNGLWHCFGACNTGGDFISFYQKIEQLTFVEACLRLSDEYSIPIEIDDNLRKEMRLKKALRSVNYAVMLHYRSNLKYNNSAIEYLKQRQIDDKIIKKFSIGTTYLNDMNKRFGKYSKYLEILKLKTEGGNDFFRNNRLIFPIFDQYNNVQGFSSRAIGDCDNSLKYLNSSESVLFDKKQALFGLNNAIKEIKERKYVYLVEGIFDCLRAHQNNIRNVVAINGVALHEPQIKLLSRYAKRFFICLDNDTTGLKRIHPIYELVKEVSPFTEIRIVVLPKDEGCTKIDLDEFILKNGRNKFIKVVRQSKPYSDYMVDEQLKDLNYSSTEQKISKLHFIKPYFQTLQSQAKKSEVIELLYTKLQLPQVDVSRILYSQKKEDEQITYFKNTESKKSIAQKYLLSLLFSDFDKTKIIDIFNKKEVEKYFSKSYHKIYKYILKKINNNVKGDDLVNNLTNQTEKLRKIIFDIIFKWDEISYLKEEDLEEYIDDNILILKK